MTTDKKLVQHLWRGFSVVKEAKWLTGESNYKVYTDGANTHKNTYYPPSIENRGYLIVDNTGDQSTLSYTQNNFEDLPAAAVQEIVKMETARIDKKIGEIDSRISSLEKNINTDYYPGQIDNSQIDGDVTRSEGRADAWAEIGSVALKAVLMQQVSQLKQEKTDLNKERENLNQLQKSRESQ